MQRYIYKAYDRAGVSHQGDITAVSVDSAKFKLKEQGFIPVSVQPPAAQSMLDRLHFFGRDKRPSLADIEFWTSQMALLLHNGIKVDRALEIARSAISHNTLKTVTGQIHDNVRSGMSLSESLRLHPDIFDPLFTSVTDIGESSGRLAEAFGELASNLAFRKEMLARTRQAMAYPLVILVVCVLSVVFIFNFIVPRFETLFSRMADPPLATVLLLETARLFTRFQWAGLILIILIPFLLGKVKNRPFFRDMLDGLAMKLPITRNLIFTAENLRFSSAMAIMLNSGVLLIDALGYAVATIGNSRIRRRLLTVCESIKQGRKLSDVMSKTGFLPETYAGIIEVGEQTGQLASIFKDIEVRTRTVYEQRLNSLITLIEPLMIIFMGLIVGTIVVIMLLSTISMHQIDF